VRVFEGRVMVAFLIGAVFAAVAAPLVATVRVKPKT
jgi:hypothetical protein